MRRLPLLLLCSLALAACKVEKSGDDRVAHATEPAPAASADSAAAPDAAAADGTTGFAAGTPGGTLEDWIGEVETGLKGVAALSQTDVSAAQKRAMDLYLSRQEYIEMYWGGGKRLATTPELIQAVTDAESRFHEVLQLVAPTGKPAEADVKKAVKALQEQYEKVIAEAHKAQVPLNPTEALGGTAKATK
jgi:hypothetical protein